MTPAPLFCDRADAGEQLAAAILAQVTKLDAAGVSIKPIVYALPRGGLPVAAPVARLLGCPLDIIVAKKITRPENPELSIGAVTADGHVLWSRQRSLKARFREVVLREAKSKAQSQFALLAPACPQVNPEGALAILVDDGIATGMTISVAVQALRMRQPAQVWIASPVAPAELMETLTQWCDRSIILETPEEFLSVSRFYELFSQVELEEAMTYLQQQNEWLS